MIFARKTVAWAVAGSLALASSSAAAQTPEKTAQQKAYEITLDCFMLAAYDRTEPQWEDDEERQKQLNVTARRIWDAAFAMGKALGLDEWTIDGHLQQHAEYYADSLIRNGEYRSKLRATCKRLNFA